MASHTLSSNPNLHPLQPSEDNETTGRVISALPVTSHTNREFYWIFPQQQQRPCFSVNAFPSHNCLYYLIHSSKLPPCHECELRRALAATHNGQQRGASWSTQSHSDPLATLGFGSVLSWNSGLSISLDSTCSVFYKSTSVSSSSEPDPPDLGRCGACFNGIDDSHDTIESRADGSFGGSGRL